MFNKSEKDFIIFERKNSYIRQLKFGPLVKISNIKFNINDQEDVMKKGKVSQKNI